MRAAAVILFLSLLTAPLVSASDEVRAAEPLVVVQDGKYGYIDRRGVIVIPAQFLWATAFENGFGTVFICGRSLAIDASGRLFPLTARAPHRDLWPTKQNGKAFFVDASGRRLGNSDFDDALRFSEGMAAVQVGDRWGFIDESGKLVIPPKFSGAYYFREGVATAELGDEYVLIDKTGRVLARGYDLTAGVVSEGRVPVSKGSKFGYLDLNGKIAVPLVYEKADSFNEGLAAVSKNNKWGYIDRAGKVAIPFVFDSAGDFGNGLAPVRLGDVSGFIDKSGKFVFRLAFKYATGFWGTEGDSDVSPFWTKDEKFGYVTSSGKVIWGPTSEIPDHYPIFGFSEEDKIQSCSGVPDRVREEIAKLPADDE
jgi:WG containing repeat